MQEFFKMSSGGSLRPNGAFAATALSAGIGCFMIGFLTVMAQANATIKDLLNWWDPAGPLTGKTGVGTIVWILCWLMFYFMWRKKEIAFKKIWWITLFLIAGALLLTFPPIFEALAGH